MVCTVCFLLWRKTLAWGCWKFEFIQILLDNWIEICFVCCAWFALSVFFYDGIFLLEALRCLSLISWIADCLVWNAWFAPHVFFRDGKCLLEAAGILSLSKYSWSIGYYLMGTDGLHCLFSLMMENSCWK